MENEENAIQEEKPVTFDDFGFRQEIMQGIADAGFTEPTPIQVKAMPEIAAGKDLIAQALTGTGKTAAFGLPTMNMMTGERSLRLLVIEPTRELAAQVSEELFRLGRHAGIHTASFTGSQSYSRQEKLLAMGIDALVATPGRLNDLIDSGHFTDVNPSYIVIDEADEMLDMGFIEDVKKILQSFQGPHQTMLFSATMPRPIVELAETIMHEPVEITIAQEETANNDIEQQFYVIEDRERTDAIVRLIDSQDVGKAMIFCRTKEEADSLNILLGGRGYNVNCLHGDMEQAQRNRVMGAFRRGEIDILVATDIAARGLDVDDVTHVFNFHLPFDSRGYVHRIGRTGRAGKSGIAITLVTPRELRQLEHIRKNVGAQIVNKLIPTRSEVTSLRLKRLFQEANESECSPEVLAQVQELSEGQDATELLAKFASRLLTGGADQGPEHIGIEGQRLSNLLSSKPRDRRGRGERRVRGERRGRRSKEDYSRTPPEELSIYEMPQEPRDAKAKEPIAKEEFEEKPREHRERKPRHEEVSEEKPRERRERRPRREDGFEEKPRRERRPRREDVFEEKPRRERRPRREDDFGESRFGERTERRERRRKDDYGRTPADKPSVYEMSRERRSSRREASGTSFRDGLGKPASRSSGASFRNGLGKPARRSSGARKSEGYNRHDANKPKGKPSKGKKSDKSVNSGKSWYME